MGLIQLQTLEEARNIIRVETGGVTLTNNARKYISGGCTFRRTSNSETQESLHNISRWIILHRSTVMQVKLLLRILRGYVIRRKKNNPDDNHPNNEKNVLCLQIPQHTFYKVNFQIIYFYKDNNRTKFTLINFIEKNWKYFQLRSRYTYFKCHTRNMSLEHFHLWSAET